MPQEEKQADGSVPNTEKRTLASLFDVGAITELIAQLNGIGPNHTYEHVRRLCRKAAQTLQTIRNELE